MGSKAPQRAPRGEKPKPPPPPPPKDGENPNWYGPPVTEPPPPPPPPPKTNPPKDRAMALARLAWDLAEENRARIESIERKLGL